MPAHSRRSLVAVVALGTAFVLTSVAAPPDPFTQLLALPVALALALPGAWWLVYRRGYDGPEVSLLQWVFPLLAPVRLGAFLVAFVPVVWLGGETVAAVAPTGSALAVAGRAAVALAALVVGQWVGFHGGWRTIRAQFSTGRRDAGPG